MGEPPLFLQLGRDPQRPDCLAGHIRFEPANPSASYLEHVSLGLNRGIPKGLSMSESCGTDSILRGQSMPRPYSNDLRARVIEEIEAGASRREAAERYELSPSVVVIWAQRWEETGSVAAKPSGGSTSPLEEYAEFCWG